MGRAYSLRQLAYPAIAGIPNESRDPAATRTAAVADLRRVAVTALFERDAGRVERLFFDDRMGSEMTPLCRTLARAHKPYRQVDRAELARIPGTLLHGGIVAIAGPLPLADFDPNTARGWANDGKPLGILDGIGNLITWAPSPAPPLSSGSSG